MARNTKVAAPEPDDNEGLDRAHLYDSNDLDLLDEVGGDDELDLLDEVIEDDAEGWVPDKPGDGVQGVVLKLGEVRSDFEEDPAKAMCPAVTLQTKDGTKLRVIGYGAVLRRELLDADPKPGDLIAVKYFGTKPIKKGKWAGKEYRHFGVAVRRASA